jgi:dTDP-4-amino-4,6-dideoxygalactose transaminase
MTSPIRTKTWPAYDKGHVFVDEEDLDAPMRALQKRHYFRYDYRSYGDTEVGRFEQALQGFLGVDHVLAVSSGTAAIALGLLSLGLEPGSLVACPGFTFAATPSAIVLAGHRPVLVECDEDLHLDLEDLQRKLSGDIRAIVVVHMRGFASDIAAIVDLARQRNIPVVEDAVPALGVRVGGKALGTFGTAGSFSTQSDKSLNTGEGGFLVCHDPTQFAKAIVLSGAYEGRYRRHFAGRVPEICDLDFPLLSFRMDEIRAALAHAEIERLPLRLAILQNNYNYVAEQLSGIPRIRLRQPTSSGSFLGDALIFRMPGAPVDEVVHRAAALVREGIGARCLGSPNDANVRCFWNWRFLFRGKTQAEVMQLLPRTVTYLRQAIDIPLSPTLTKDDCDDLIAAVHKVFRGSAPVRHTPRSGVTDAASARRETV